MANLWIKKPLDKLVVEADESEKSLKRTLGPASLIALGLVLFVLTFVVLALSRMLIARLARGEGTRT